ncbi:MAG: hypothetical protein K2N74_06240 [Clostridiales bacterium]|nr:hypothetical protein [Clostridiales bacterium]
MNVWRLTAANHLSKTDEKLPDSVSGKIKVRVTKVLLEASDAAIFSGEIKTKYPLTLGKFAIGIVAEDSPNPQFSKGSRVLLHSFVSAPYSGTEKKDFSEEDDTPLCGYTRDGYLRDFVFRTAEEMTLLPDNISDADALLAHYVAFAEAAVDKVNPEAGDHVAVLGANLVGTIIGQLLLYRQAVPVLIDTNTDRLEAVKRCGIDYTLLADDTLLENVAQITGGRLASGACIASEELDNVPLSLCAKNSRVVFSHLYGLDVSVNLEQAIKKQLTLSGISDVTGQLDAALSLIASKAVKLSNVEISTAAVETAGSVLANFPAEDDSKMVLLDLI